MAMTTDKVKEIMRLTDSFSRMESVINLRDHLTQAEWLKLLGENWTDCDNIREWRMHLSAFVGTVGPVPDMMDNDELDRWHALPDKLTVYRGCGAAMLLGASWTLDEALANSFPFTTRYHVTNPVVVTATVRKANVLAIKLCRGESEIITFSARRTSVRPADEAQAMLYHEKKHKEEMERLEMFRNK